MVSDKWQIRHIQNVNEIYADLGTNAIIAFDTETTGLHIVNDKPFVLTFAMIHKGLYTAFTYEFDKNTPDNNKKLINAIYKATENGLLIGHNIIYDLHMLTNIHKVVDHTNLLDTQTLIRLGTDAIPEDRGGAPLRLKAFAKQYIDASATTHERVLNLEKSAIAKAYNQQLYNAVSNKKEFQALLDRSPEDIDDLPPQYRSIYLNWLDTLPPRARANMTGNVLTHADIPYNIVNRNVLLQYAAYDVIYTYEIYEMLMPVIKNREQLKTLTLEQSLILPLYRMTRTGFKINKPYILETKEKLKAYIIKQKQQLINIAGIQVTANQNAVIKQLINIKYQHPEVDKTDEPTLAQLQVQIEKIEPELYEFISIILELRTLTKWYKTYLIRFARTMQHEDYVYTGINSAGAVTGRFTSDFQQFPKDTIKTYKGEPLFTPRRMVAAHDDHYMLYLDYSQIELRIQAMYTILLNKPDTNLCRAYMPYECTHYRTNIMYDYTNTTHLSNWNRKQPNSNDSVWLLPNGTPWTPTDLHAKTTAEAYPDIDPHSAQFKKLRSEVGKRANFACNYGAKAARIQAMFPNASWEEAQRIYEAYVKTFPGVVNYQKYCYTLLNQQNWGDNLYGRRYYNIPGHNYANAAIQGTGADLLKYKIVELDKFFIDNNYKTRIQMNIHDEISFIVPKNEIHLTHQIKAIMEHVENTLVPIVAEQELSTTTWADKKGFSLDEQHNIIMEGI